MAEKIVYRVDVDADGAKAKVEQLGKSFDNTKSKAEGLGSTVGKATGGISKMTDATRRASNANMELTRVFSDMPYGIRGITNNVQQLAANFMGLTTTVDQTTGKALGFRGALTAMGSSLMGPAGILLGFTAVTAAIDYFAGNQKKAKKATTELTGALSQQEAKLLVAKAILEDTSASLEDKEVALGHVNDEYKDSNLLLDKNNNLTEDSKKNLDKLTKSLIKNATAKAYLNKITEIESKKVTAQLKFEKARQKFLDKNKDITSAQLDAKLAQIQELEKKKAKAKGSAGRIISREIQSLKRELGGFDKDDVAQEFASFNKAITEASKESKKIIELAKQNGGLGSLFSVGDDDDKDDKKNADRQADLLEKLLEENRLRNKTAREKELEEESIQYEKRKKLAKGNKSLLQQIEDNHLADIDAINQKWNAKELEDNKKITDKNKKEAKRKEKELDRKRETQLRKDIQAVKELTRTRLENLKVVEDAMSGFNSIMSEFASIEHDEEMTRLQQRRETIQNDNSLSVEQKKAAIAQVEEEERAAKERQINAEYKAFAIQQGIEVALMTMKMAINAQEQINIATLTAAKAKAAATGVGIDASVAAGKATMSVGEFINQMGPWGMAAWAVSAGVAIASIVSAKKKAKQQISALSPGASSGGGGATGSTSKPATPVFNVVGRGNATVANQNEAINRQDNQNDTPIKAYVVSGEVTTAQELDRKAIEDNSL